MRDERCSSAENPMSEITFFCSSVSLFITFMNLLGHSSGDETWIRKNANIS
jgi:hypothetical protein